LILDEQLYTLDRSSAGFGHGLARVVRRRREKETTPTAETPPMRKSATKAIRE
jgi:hypothetical protein